MRAFVTDLHGVRLCGRAGLGLGPHRDYIYRPRQRMSSERVSSTRWAHGRMWTRSPRRTRCSTSPRRRYCSSPRLSSTFAPLSGPTNWPTSFTALTCTTATRRLRRGGCGGAGAACVASGRRRACAPFQGQGRWARGVHARRGRWREVPRRSGRQLSRRCRPGWGRWPEVSVVEAKEERAGRRTLMSRLSSGGSRSRVMSTS